MRLNHKHLLKILSVITVGVIAACTPVRYASDIETSLLNQKRATEMFFVGYTHIIEKYIETVPLAQLAIEGIRGLSSIDPALTFKKAGDIIVLSLSDNEIGQFGVPSSNDINGWAELTSHILLKSRSASSDLKKASEEKLYEAVFDGALSNLDIYSRYAGLKEARLNRARRDGFGGIGIRFKISSRTVRIIRILKNTPAERAGILVGDQIIRVGDVPVQGLSTRDVSDQLRGAIDSKVNLTIQRGNILELKTFVLERHLIVTPTVNAKFENGIIFIRLSGFNQQTSKDLTNKIQQAISTFDNKIKGFVLDLRSNPGGLLDQSIKIANLFLAEGKIVSTRGRHPESIQYYEASGHDIARGLPFVILIDGKSASSSEVLAAALQDRGRAVIIGTNSFGKGTVQTVIQMPNGGEITLTWSRLSSPAGYMLHGLGLHPSFCTSGSRNFSMVDITQSIADEALVRQEFKSWRSTGFYEHAQRLALRAKCPAERRDKTTELRAASELLENSVLYARALELSSPGLRKPLEEALKMPERNKNAFSNKK